MTDLASSVRRALQRKVIGGAATPDRLSIAIAGQEVWGRRSGMVTPLGGALDALVVASAATTLCDDGWLSAGTTVRECIPAPLLPSDLDPTMSVRELLGVLGTALRSTRSPWPPAVLTCVLGQMVAAACGEPLAAAVDRVVVARAGMWSARSVGDCAWTAGLVDLRRLADGAAWDELHRAGVLTTDVASGRVGITSGAMAIWRYPADDLTVAARGHVVSVLHALDAVVCQQR